MHKLFQKLSTYNTWLQNMLMIKIKPNYSMLYFSEMLYIYKKSSFCTLLRILKYKRYRHYVFIVNYLQHRKFLLVLSLKLFNLYKQSIRIITTKQSIVAKSLLKNWHKIYNLIYANYSHVTHVSFLYNSNLNSL